MANIIDEIEEVLSERFVAYDGSSRHGPAKLSKVKNDQVQLSGIKRLFHKKQVRRILKKRTITQWDVFATNKKGESTLLGYWYGARNNRHEAWSLGNSCNYSNWNVVEFRTTSANSPAAKLGFGMWGLVCLKRTSGEVRWVSWKPSLEVAKKAANLMAKEHPRSTFDFRYFVSRDIPIGFQLSKSGLAPNLLPLARALKELITDVVESPAWASVEKRAFLRMINLHTRAQK